MLQTRSEVQLHILQNNNALCFQHTGKTTLFTGWFLFDLGTLLATLLLNQLGQHFFNGSSHHVFVLFGRIRELLESGKLKIS